jgi:hypothetical protein
MQCGDGENASAEELPFADAWLTARLCPLGVEGVFGAHSDGNLRYVMFALVDEVD